MSVIVTRAFNGIMVEMNQGKKQRYKIVYFKYYLILIYLLLSWQNANSQPNIDSLKSLLSEQNGVEHIITLSNLSRALSRTDYDQALRYGRLALEESFSLQDSIRVCKLLIDLSYIHKYSGDLKTALNNLNRAYFIAKKKNDYKSLISSLTALGSIYYSLAIYDKALQYHFESIKLKEESNDKPRLATSYNNIGLVFYKVDDTEQALEYFEKALKLKLERGDTLRSISTYINIGLVYNELQEDLLAKVNFRNVIAISQKYHSVRYLGDAFNGLGNVYIRENNYDSAYHFLNLALTESKNKHSNFLLGSNYYLLAKLNILHNRMDRAINYLKKSQAISMELDDKVRQKNNMKLFAEIYEKKNQYDSAFYFQKKYSILEDSIFNERRAKNIANLQIALSEQQNLEIIEAQDKQLTQNRFFFLFLFSVFILGIILFLVIFKNYKTTSRINRKLQESRKQVVMQKNNLEIKNSELAKAQKIINEQNSTLKDINEDLELKVRKRTRQLESSNLELEKVVKDLDQFIYKTSHDLRGPLATMQGIINLGVMEAGEPVMADYFNTLNKVTANLNNVLSRLIEVHETYQKHPEYSVLNPREEIHNTVERVFKYSHDPTIRIKTDLEANGDWMSDRGLFVMIVENMLRNAFQYTDRGESTINIKSYYENNLLNIIFEDNGFGIQPGDEEKVFNIFFKGSPKTGGTGLELYTVKIAVEKLGGNITLIKPLRNTIYKITLPRIDMD